MLRIIVTLNILVYLWLVVKSTSEIQNGLPFSSSLNEVGSQVSYCAALNLAQEVGTRRHWVPDLYCEDYLRNRVEGHQYILDYDIAIDIIAGQLLELPVKGDGLDLIVLDIDETALSNLPYYKEHRYGITPFNHTNWNEWVLTSGAVPFPKMVSLVNKLIGLNWSVAFVTGRDDIQREATELNLERGGYTTWKKLFMRSTEQSSLPAAKYKSQCRLELESLGFRIWANIGDQWSDLEGKALGFYNFKLPNPFYFVG